MSLEATIAENTAALRELIATMKAGVPTTAAQVAAVVAQAEPEKQADAQAEKPVKTPAKKETAAATAPAPQPSTATDAGASAEPAALTYQDAATAVTNLAKAKGRDTAVAVLGKFGAAKLPDVKPEQFADVVKACKEAAEA